MQQINDTQADEFDLRAFLAWCWWLVKTVIFTVSITLNIVFFLLLLGVRAGY
ncbi:hypothetical protein [Chloroflexus sp.]|uniref:hypothetical protein n=1 Tax=Chloroflexus sp. TaxID=1904827 RepID=UPI002ACD92CD|nr:hypothetical protein [Chloroflexus sp.]